MPAPYTIADRSGAYVLFNVQSSVTSIRGYRRGLELEAATVDASGDARSISPWSTRTSRRSRPSAAR